MKVPKYTIGVVIAVYNVEKYLNIAIDSIINQKFTKGTYQIILVDDGSTDHSGHICDQYASSYSNIISIHKENGGVASARNEGLNYIDAELIYFMDSDDYIDDNVFEEVYKFYEKHNQEIDVITIPIKLCGRQTGDHWQNFKFNRGSRVINLLEEYEVSVSNTNSSFFSSNVKNLIKFDNRLADAEDMKVLMDILLEKMKLGVVSSCNYHYRKHDGSLLDTAAKKKEWYINHIPCFVEETIKKYVERFGYLPMFIQYEIFSNLQWRFRNNNEQNELIHGDEFIEYKLRLLSILKYFDDEVIIKQKMIDSRTKCFILTKKYGRNPLTINEEWDIKLVFNNNIIGSISKSKLYLEFIDIHNSYVTLDCMVKLYGLDSDCPLSFYLDANNKRIYSYDLTISDSDNILEENSAQRYRFKFNIDLNEKVISIQKIGILYGNKKVDFKIISSGKFFPVFDKYPNAYYIKNNWKVTIDNKKIIIMKVNNLEKIASELKYDYSLIRNKDQNLIKYVLLRNLYHVLSHLTKHKRLLLLDRVDKADDNAEALYRYIINNDKEHIVKFAISSDCPDYRRLKSTTKLLNIFSLRYSVYYITCSMVITSNNDYYINKPFDNHVFDDILYKIKHVFLQHGVTKDDISNWLGKYSSNLDAIVTVTNLETESFHNPSYYLTTDQIWQTGFPRHDLLYSKCEKIILIMPTWRKYLNKSNDEGKWSGITNFEHSDYYNFYNNLLNDERLLNTLKETDYRLLFIPHPNMQKYDGLFTKNKFLSIEYSNNVIYRDIFAKSALLVTDYSSVAFDFALLKKPIVYSQFDKELLWLGDHIGKQSYFDYEKNGFGEVAYNINDTVDLIIKYINNSCRLTKEYEKRIDSTFKYMDKSNSERVYKKIIELEKKEGR